MESVEFEKLLTLTIAKLYALAGHKSPDVAQMKIYVTEMRKEITKNYHFLQVDEVINALENGVKGKYGAYMGINIPSMLSWLNTYLVSHEREQRKAQQINLLPETCALTESEKIEILKEGVIRKYNQYRETGNVYDFGNSSYNFLERIGIINLTAEQKRIIFEDAKRELKEKAEAKREISKSIVRRSLYDFIQNLSVVGTDAHNQAKQQAKIIALRNYFDRIITFGYDLRILINDAVTNDNKNPF